MKKIQSIRMKLEKKKLNPDYADITESLSEELVEHAAEKQIQLQDDSDEMSDEGREQSALVAPMRMSDTGSLFDSYADTIENQIGEADQAKIEREKYMMRLMNFRKDETMPNLDGSSEEGSGDDEEDPAEEAGNELDNAIRLVDSIDEKMAVIGNVVKGIDKRMSYNLRLISNVVAGPDGLNAIGNEEVNESEENDAANEV